MSDDQPYRCPGCRVREPFEHRCERDDGAWMGDPPCRCTDPGCFGDTHRLAATEGGDVPDRPTPPLPEVRCGDCGTVVDLPDL